MHVEYMQYNSEITVVIESSAKFHIIYEYLLWYNTFETLFKNKNTYHVCYLSLEHNLIIYIHVLCNHKYPLKSTKSLWTKYTSETSMIIVYTITLLWRRHWSLNKTIVVRKGFNKCKYQIVDTVWLLYNLILIKKNVIHKFTVDIEYKLG